VHAASGEACSVVDGVGIVLGVCNLQGDLKAGNVLLQHSIHGSYGQIAKISDFGLSTMLLSGATHRSTASLGTITHCAPEVLRSGRLSKATDVYAYGILSECHAVLWLRLIDRLVPTLASMQGITNHAHGVVKVFSGGGGVQHADGAAGS